VPVRYTNHNCKVETTFVIQPNGQYREEIVLSVDPACTLSLAIEERGSTVTKLSPRFRR
jgi:hypothetical protein